MLVCPAGSSLKTLEGGPRVGGDKKEGKHFWKREEWREWWRSGTQLSNVVCDFTGIV